MNKLSHNILAICWALIGLTACAQKPSAPAASGPQKFTIKGTIGDTREGETVYMAKVGGRGLTPVDSVKISGGKFSFEGEIDNGAHLLFVVALADGAIKNYGPVVLESGDYEVEIPSGAMGMSKMPHFADFDKWMVLSTRDNELTSQMQKFATAAQSGQMSISEASRLVDSLAMLRLNNFVAFIRKEMPSKISDMVFEQNADRMPVTTRDQLIAEMEAKKSSFPGLQAVKYRIATAAQAAQERESRGAVGNKFTDFEMADRDGKMVKLSDIVKKNKLTLVDFWASWCGPCRAEMPHVRQAYEAYHYMGLEIVGVSLDQNRQNWEKAIKDMDLNWLHLSDLKGWGCAAAGLYGVHSIPSSLLIDQNGTIVAKDLRGSALLQTIGGLLNK